MYDYLKTILFYSGNSLKIVNKYTSYCCIIAHDGLSGKVVNISIYPNMLMRFTFRFSQTSSIAYSYFSHAGSLINFDIMFLFRRFNCYCYSGTFFVSHGFKELWVNLRMLNPTIMKGVIPF